MFSDKQHASVMFERREVEQNAEPAVLINELVPYIYEYVELSYVVTALVLTLYAEPR